MEPSPEAEGSPPVPPRSPLREAANLDISDIFHNPTAFEEWADQSSQSHYDALGRTIDRFIDRLRPGTSSMSLTSPGDTSRSRRRSKPYMHFSSNVASVSSIYSQDSGIFHPRTSSAPTTSRPSYSSSRPVSMASTRTSYSNNSVSQFNKSATHLTSTPTAQPTSLTTDQLFSMIEKLPPIIYRHVTKEPKPALNDPEDIDDDDDDELFPPHSGVRPPPPSMSRPQSNHSPERRQTLPALLTKSVLSVPKRATSLRFALQKQRPL